MTGGLELSDLHDLPWSIVEGAHVRVEKEVDGPPKDPIDTEIREGEIVGRSVGTGLYNDSERGETVANSMGPFIYLDTAEDTVLEVYTDDPINELLAFEPEVDDAE